MVKPNEKLASSLRVLKTLQDSVGNVIRTNEISRTHRERLQRAGFLNDVISGWWVVTRPGDRPGDSTHWYASFWDFCRRYCEAKFVDEWCLSPEHSLLKHSESTTIPRQVIVWSAKASGNNRGLPFDTSIYDLKRVMPDKDDLTQKDGLSVLTIEAALVRVTDAFFKNQTVEAQIILSSLKTTAPLLAKLLDGGHVKAAGRIAGALRRLDRGEEADKIIKRMRAAEYDVREVDPFVATPALVPLQSGIPPLVGRLRSVWENQRQIVVDMFPPDAPLPDDAQGYLSSVDEIYVNDAYNSLSIEGYQVDEELIERVSDGSYDPKAHEEDRNSRDAMAASGYYLAFQAVRSSIGRILNGEKAASVVDEDYDNWFAQLFQPMVQAGLTKPGSLAGFRNHPVFLRGSRHTPPRAETIPDGIGELFSLIANEPSASVRAVFGHWLIGYIHPYPDGNGRMARFMMNALLASGGHPWTIIRLKDRKRYMEALEVASMEFQIEPFAQLILERLNWSMTELETRE